jgi:Family of unknown function (DUF6498)
MGAAAVIVAVMFIVSASVFVYMIAKLDLHNMRNISALAGTLFRLFWLLGWSLGVLVLGALAVLLCFYRESARLAGGRLVFISSLGPLKTIAEYELARMRNLRTEPDKGDGARVCFDYGEGGSRLGNAMPAADAERIVAALRAAMPASAAPPPAAPATVPQVPAPPAAEPPAAAAPLPLGSVFALIAANLVPLLGVLLLGWRLDEVIVLFWAESAVIAFYTLLKIAVVGRWLAAFAGVFFVGHFGMFMAIHFLFIYEMFVRGPNTRGPEPGALEALAGIFTPLWPALLALVLSHGFSFATNFLGRREYREATVSSLMAAPYRRVVLMQFTLILGGWGVLALESPIPALVVLIVFKMAADVYSHRRERTGNESRA